MQAIQSIISSSPALPRWLLRSIEKWAGHLPQVSSKFMQK